MAFQKKIILIDADDVLEDLSWAWVDYLNERYKTTTSREDLFDWDMSKSFPTLTHAQVYDASLEEDLYRKLKPLPDAPYYVKKMMDDGHKIYVVTNTPYQVVKVKVEEVLLKYYPFLDPNDITITAHKQLIHGDILIDDGFHNLINGPYEKILVDAPYNRKFDAEGNGMVRTYNWKQIYQEVCRICGKELDEEDK